MLDLSEAKMLIISEKELNDKDIEAIRHLRDGDQLAVLQESASETYTGWIAEVSNSLPEEHINLLLDLVDDMPDKVAWAPAKGRSS